MARIKMICMLFVCTILANQFSMVATITFSKRFWMIFAKDLEVFLILINKTLDNMINLNGNRFISIEKAIVLAPTS